jgi:hypothetical protein
MDLWVRPKLQKLKNIKLLLCFFRCCNSNKAFTSLYTWLYLTQSSICDNCLGFYKMWWVDSIPNLRQEKKKYLCENLMQWLRQIWVEKRITVVSRCFLGHAKNAETNDGQAQVLSNACLEPTLCFPGGCYLKTSSVFTHVWNSK